MCWSRGARSSARSSAWRRGSMRFGRHSANKKPGRPALVEGWLAILGERLDALGTKHLANDDPVLLDLHALEIGLELAPGCPHRMAAAVAEHGPLPAIFAFRHD